MSLRVLFDTTTLCSAFLNPAGTDMALLQMARSGLIEPVISQEVVSEFIANCRKGFVIGGKLVTFDEDFIDAFFELLEPLLDIANLARLRVGRAAGPLYPLREEGGVWIVQVPRQLAHTRTHMRGGRILALKDIHDFHVVIAALRYRCDYVCTYNHRDLPDGLRIGSRLEIAKPERLLRLLSR